MQFTEAFKLALQSLWANKLRSILTLIGVVMGVASVIMVITLVNGANNYVGTKLSGYGADVFTVTPHVRRDLHRRRLLPLSEAQDPAHRGLPGGPRRLHRLQRSGRAARPSPPTSCYNGHSSNNTEMRGYTWTMLSLNNIDIALGRGFTPGRRRPRHPRRDRRLRHCRQPDAATATPSARRFASTAFPTPIVGVGERQGKTLGQSQDNWVAVPITPTSRPMATTTR